MLPGYLHFDVRRGLSADMLNASMAALLTNHHCVRQAFDALGLEEISYVIGKDSRHGVMGHSVHFYAGDVVISKTGNEDVASSIPKRTTRHAKISPKWDGRGLDTSIHEDPAAISPLSYKSEFLRNCQAGDVHSIGQLRNLLSSSNLKPSIRALGVSILEKLECPVFSKRGLCGSDALWLFCHLVMLCAQVDALNPKFISATTISIGALDIDRGKEKSLTMVDRLWVNTILTMMPIIEVDEGLDIDVLAIAFIKTLAGQFGARGNSTILQLGVGFSSLTSNEDRHIEALWCEAHLPESMNELGPRNHARIDFIHEVSGLVPATTDLPNLCTTLSLHGAKAIAWQLVHGEKSHTFYNIKFNCGDDDKREIIEAFLIKGGAQDVLVHQVEHHELNRRLVAVPMGFGNKTSMARFYEYIYYNKIVRVEPVQEDLDNYVEKTNYSTDVARSDLLLAWKKWRKRIAEEGP